MNEGKPTSLCNFVYGWTKNGERERLKGRQRQRQIEGVRERQRQRMNEREGKNHL